MALDRQPLTWEELMEMLRGGGINLLPGESEEEEIKWVPPPNNSSHVGAIAWKRNDDNPPGTRNPLGRLLVVYITGGGGETPKAPVIYAYEDIPYSQFYYFANRTPSAGRYTYYTLSKQEGRVIASVRFT